VDYHGDRVAILPCWLEFPLADGFYSFRIQPLPHRPNHFYVSRLAICSNDCTQNADALIFSLSGFRGILRIWGGDDLGRADPTADSISLLCRSLSHGTTRNQWFR